MSYSEEKQVEPGLKFKSASGLIVETTGHSQYVDTASIYVHEVKIVEGTAAGQTFWHNLDAAQQL